MNFEKIIAVLDELLGCQRSPFNKNGLKYDSSSTVQVNKNPNNYTHDFKNHGEREDNKKGESNVS